MLSPRPKTKRFLETIQMVLSLASVCAVVDASFIQGRLHEAAGYYGGSSPQREARADLVSDLARTERRRREAVLREALEQR